MGEVKGKGLKGEYEKRVGYEVLRGMVWERGGERVLKGEE